MVQNVHRLILVTGPSGAGRTTATHALEDLGYETIDNIPLGLAPKVIDGKRRKSIALVLDSRNRDFSIQAFFSLIEALQKKSLQRPEILFLDCRRDVLLRRFSETRRRHPMAKDQPPGVGVDLEQSLLSPLQEQADFVIDSSNLTPHEMKRQISSWFAIGDGMTLTLSLQSFSYKKGMPQDVDMVFDCRFLRNPHWEAELRRLSGLDQAVGKYIESDKRYQGFLQRSLNLIQFLLPAYQEEGKSHLTVGLGCTGGHHRSVFVAESLAKALAQCSGPVSIRHRDLDHTTEEKKDLEDWPA